MQALLNHAALGAVFAATLVACGGNVAISDSSANGDGGVVTTPPKPRTPKPETPPRREPKLHRETAVVCDGVRPLVTPNAPPVGSPCPGHADCTAGINGRCDNTGRGRWGCTYDECTTDSDCGAGVCSCEGAFQSDANRCLTTNGCRVDADCGGGTGFCSPTLGFCGRFDKAVGYFCHTPQDECIDDEDCGGSANTRPGYCAYDKTAARWKCSSNWCAG